MLPIVGSVAVLASPAAAAASVEAAAAALEPLFESATYRSTGGSTLLYRYYAPSASEGVRAKRPLVLFLHGEEAAGTDNVRKLTTSEGATIWVEPDHLAKNPTYVLAPQVPPGADWGRDPVYRDTVDMLKQFLSGRPDVEPDRIYVVGFSTGGTGAWTMLLRNPGLFAAAIAISGNANAFLADEEPFAAIRSTRCFRSTPTTTPCRRCAARSTSSSDPTRPWWSTRGWAREPCTSSSSGTS